MASIMQGTTPSLTITNGTGILFNGCVFGNAPTVTITNNGVTRFVNCYTKDGLTQVTA